MSQHKATMDKVMQSAFKHRRAGIEVSTAVAAIEAMVLTTIAQNEIVENSDEKAVGRCRAALCHKSFGKRLADAMSTIDAIIAADSLSVTAADKELSGAHKQGLRKVMQGSVANKALGTDIADMVSKAEQAIDLLIAAYPLDTDLVDIKAILES